jgi:hypothetical protein
VRNCTARSWQDGPGEELLLTEIGISVACSLSGVGDLQHKPLGRDALNTALTQLFRWGSLHAAVDVGTSSHTGVLDKYPTDCQEMLWELGNPECKDACCLVSG